MPITDRPKICLPQPSVERERYFLNIMYLLGSSPSVLDMFRAENVGYNNHVIIDERVFVLFFSLFFLERLMKLVNFVYIYRSGADHLSNVPKIITFLLFYFRMASYIFESIIKSVRFCVRCCKMSPEYCVLIIFLVDIGTAEQNTIYTAI